MSASEIEAPRRDSYELHDWILLVAGLLVVFVETVDHALADDAVDPSLLLISAAMMGLPQVFRAAR